MSIMAMMQAVAGSGGDALPEPRAVRLLGVDESVNIGEILAGHVPGGTVGAFTLGMSVAGFASGSLQPFLNRAATGGIDSAALKLALSSADRLDSTWSDANSGRTVIRAPAGSTMSLEAPTSIVTTWDGVGLVAPSDTPGAVYQDDAALSVSEFDLSGGAGTDTAELAVGKGAGTAYSAFTFWCLWWIRAELTASQVAAAGAFRDAGDYIGEDSGMLGYLQAIDSSARIMAVTDADDLTGGTGSIAIYGGSEIEYATPINTTSGDLVAVPA